MDAHTLELLQFGRVRELVANQACSSLGKEKARGLEPLVRLDAVRRELGRVAEMIEALTAKFEPPLGGLRDIRPAIKRAGLGVLLEIEQVIDIRGVLELTGRVHDYWMRLGTEYDQLELMLSDVTDLRHLVRAIDAVVDERGRVHDHATPGLSSIRAEIRQHEDRIQNEIRKLTRDPEVKRALRYGNATLNAEHFVLPVAVNYRHLVPGVVHRTSSSGETIFVEPARVAEINAELVLLRNAEEREVRKVLRHLTTVIGKDADALLKSLEVLAELDLLVAKARYALAYDMHPAEVHEGRGLRLLDARHPVLLDLFRREAAAARSRPPKPAEDASEHEDGDAAPEGPREVVPISVRVGEDFDLLLITGPNTGGKTVALKTVGLLAAMTLAGLAIPARAGSRVPMYADILADIGDEQSLEQSLSTFSSHISRIGLILGACGPETLVLLDEVGAGTEPSEGAALGRAILDELVERRVPAMITTHLNDLKSYALYSDRTENGAVEFDSESLRPTFRLLIGQTGESCALRIARRLKLPRKLVDRAYEHLRKRRGKHDREIRQIQEIRAEAERVRSEAIEQELEARAQADAVAREKESLAREAAVAAELERARAALRSGDHVRVTRFDKDGTVVRVDHRKGRATVRVGGIEWQLPVDELVPILGN